MSIWAKRQDLGYPYIIVFRQRNKSTCFRRHSSDIGPDLFLRRHGRKLFRKRIVL
jgi:hypothetical protein